MSLERQTRQVLDPPQEEARDTRPVNPSPMTRIDAAMLLGLATSGLIVMTFGPVWLFAWGDSGSVLNSYFVPIGVGIALGLMAILVGWYPRVGGTLMIAAGSSFLAVSLRFWFDIGMLSVGFPLVGVLAVFVIAAMAVGAGILALQGAARKHGSSD
jgi:hypothetical protein